MLTQEVISKADEVVRFCIDNHVSELKTYMQDDSKLYGMFIITCNFQETLIYNLCHSEHHYEQRKNSLKYNILNDNTTIGCISIICNHELNIHTPTDFYQECIDSIK